MRMGRQTGLAQARTEGAALDVSHLPSFGFSHRSLMWWGTLGLMAIEGTVFALAVGVYFYLRSFASRWPMENQPPALLWGTVNTLLMLASLWAGHFAKRAAEALDLQGVRLGLLLSSAFALAILGVRVLEFGTLNCRWDGSAYGSIVWMLMGLHTLHLITDAYDTLVLTALMHTGHLEGRRYVDVSENALYWYFVVWSWVPLYAVVYGVPRLG
ncbi:cytochrome c oxidase subunit 3 [Azohydromonas australica]|uniref:cytochrome c oxidase subunit 3 n=1 Tax=Azohydromonas australica TaxID=364039 RepID=UPI001EE4DD48|nr:cytochrome c oxidase subunit 3 [Azohydromonas australica]